MAKTCTACRSRKMRCDGTNPPCGPCSRARKPLDCSYADTSLVSQGPKPALLQKGAACLACRRKKKKCDAIKPACNTCVVAGKATECMYDDDVKEDQVTSLTRENQELRRTLQQNQLQLQQMRQHHQLQQPDRSLIEFPSSSIVGDWYAGTTSNEDGSMFDFSNTSPFPFIPDVSHVPNVPTMPYVDPVVTNIFFQRLQAGAAFSDTRHLNALICASPASAYEQYVQSFAHNYSIGFYLRQSKWQAIRLGDYSGVVVHPAVVHMALLIGGEIYTSLGRKGPLELDADLELNRTLESLAKPPDPVSLVTVYCLIAWFLFFKRRISDAQAYLLKAYGVVVQYDMNLAGSEYLDFEVRPVSPAEPSEDMKEMVTALCELAYLDKAATIVLKVQPLLPQAFDRQLKQLHIWQPWLCLYSIVVLRCRSVYFLQEALRISRSDYEPNSPGYLALPADWKDQYWDTLTNASSHASALTIQMMNSSLRADPRECVALKVCLMIALAAQLELFRLPGFQHRESRQQMITTICQIIAHTETISEHEDTLLDPILGTCWTIVAATLRQEKQLQGDMAAMAPNFQWATAFRVMIQCANKVGQRIPYLEHALDALKEHSRSVPLLVQ